MTVEAWLDETPGETRGIIARDGWFTHLLIERAGDTPEHQLGARVVGRVTEVMPALGAAFVDLGVEGAGFLPFRKGDEPDVGEKVEVEVVAEPRGDKGPTLKCLGAGEGAPRLLLSGPGVAETLAKLAPGVTPVTGLAAIQASWDAEEEALCPGQVVEGASLDVMVERTRAMVTVDLDWAPGAGLAVGAKARERANREGLKVAARMIGLKRWGGLAAVDLIGGAQDGEVILTAAKAAFREPETAFGPVSKFGVLQLTTPWRRTPIEEVLAKGAEFAAVRALRHALLSDTAAARVTLVAGPKLAKAAASWAAQLGPRAQLKTDPALAAGAYRVED